MKPSFLHFLILAVSLVPTSAHAAAVWSLDWVNGTTAVVGDDYHGLLTFKPNNTSSSSQSANPVVVYLGVNSKALQTSSQHYTNQVYAFELRLTDLASGAYKNFWFVGDLNGTVSENSSKLTNHLFSAAFHNGILLGHDLYDISFGPFVNPVPNDKIAGKFYVHVDYQPQPVIDPPVSGSARDSVSVNASPEPASASLAVIGVSLLGLLGRWRRKRASTASIVE